jgi:hypothetical protein
MIENTTSINSSNEMLVHGTLMMGYAQACLNLNIVAGRQAMELITKLQPNHWYPLSHMRELESFVLRSYKNSDPILLKVGIEMMRIWYTHGPGRSLVNRGAAFLHFQTGSSGFQSVVQGPSSTVGSFDLVAFDESRGHAVVHTTTLFNRKMECGVLIGGVISPGDLDYVDVNNDENPDYIVIEFH